MSSSAQRKRRTTGSPLDFRLRTKTSRGANARRPANTNRAAIRAANVNRTSDGDPAAVAETIAVMDNTEDSVEEVVDLTCEGAEAAVVDLTNNDSVLLVDEGPQNGRVPTSESYVVSSDEDEDAPPVLNGAIMSSVQTNSSSRLYIPLHYLEITAKWSNTILQSNPGRLRGRSAVPCVWTLTLRLWRAADWLFPLNVVTCSAVSV
ncbi:E3 ubiquitin-protein ligase RNF4 isoform X3 [Clinocottus analis]|uniref:E3 ubiquitin-protein ligase RNF4 isoform X3 n=1 Tax=Clinocottus analis TaxID=304258 RepID=UPI0035BEBD9F